MRVNWGSKMFKPLRSGDKILGYTFERDRGFYFFGTRHTSREDLARLFPHYHFCFLRQVHGNAIIEARPEETPEADAHFTSVPGRALVSQTADCVPILVQSGEQVCAIHAGWKGVALGIVGQAGDHLKRSNAFSAIGPHISASSFEVGEDVARKLLQSAPGAKRDFTAPHSPGKVLFDLRALVLSQLEHAFGPGLTAAHMIADTKSDELFHSFRRDRERAGRQYSFVVINP